MRLLVGVVWLVAACGRIGFDDHSADGAMPDATVEPTKIALGTGGDARAIAVPGTTLDVMYVQFGDNHLVRTDDGGATFHDCGFFPRSITSLDADATGRVLTATVSGVWMSTDNCATFAQLGSLTGYTTVAVLDGSNVLASDFQGLQRWDGTQWTIVPTPFGATYLNTIMVRHIALGVPYLIGTGAGIAVSGNGTTYTVSNTGLASLQVLRFARSGSTLYAATGNGVHISTDAGASWTQLSSGFGDATAVDPGDPNFIAHASTVGLEISIDGGSSWSPDLRPADFAHSRVQAFAFDPKGSGQLVAATGRGLFETDAHNMPFRPLGSLDTWTVTAIAPDATGTARYGATTAGMIDLSTEAITDVGGFDFTTANDLLAVGSTLYAAGRRLSRSTGGAFTDLYAPDSTDQYWMVNVREDAGALFATSYVRALRSTDNGMTWNGPTLPVSFLHALLVIPGSPRKLYVGANTGILYSSDGGVTFAQTAITDECNALLSLSDGSILAGTNRGLYRAPAAGGTFTLITSPALLVRALASRGSTLYAVLNDTVQSSTDGGMTFTPTAGFSGHSPISLWVDPDGSLVVGTLGWGVYRLHP